MKLRFTHHARSQALFRGILESLIAGTIRKPDSVEPAPGGALMCRKLTENGILEVICKKEKGRNEYLVITAYYR